MPTQRDTNRKGVMCYVPLDTLAKVRTVIQGKRVSVRLSTDRRQMTVNRAMGMSDFFIACVEKAVEGIVPTRESVAWCRDKKRKNELAHQKNKEIQTKDEERQRQNAYTNRCRLEKRLALAEKKRRTFVNGKGDVQEIQKLDSSIAELKKLRAEYDDICSRFSDRRKRRETDDTSGS